MAKRFGVPAGVAVVVFLAYRGVSDFHTVIEVHASTTPADLTER